MEAIINKLSEIEATASKIMETAINETQLQDKQLQEKIAEFDRQLEEETNEKLIQLRKQLQEQSEKELNDLKASTEKKLAFMDQYLNENFDEITNEIYHKIIGM